MAENIQIAVDDTIHFLRRVQREYADLSELRGAVRETMRTTGSALFSTSLVLATGFAVEVIGPEDTAVPAPNRRVTNLVTSGHRTSPATRAQRPVDCPATCRGK
jgi:hypothetical protein